MPLSLNALEERARAVTRPFRALYPFAPHFIDVGGRALHYVDEGEASGSSNEANTGKSVVLCVHGNPTWSFYWRRVIEALSPAARVVAPDHLGMGLSDRVPGGVKLRGHVDALVQLIDELDLDEMTLVCHDWGGAIGFGAVAQRQDRFRRFIVTNTAAFPSGQMPKRIAACRVPGIGRLAVQGGNAFARAATRMTTVVPLEDDVKRGFLAPYRSWKDREQIWRFVEDIPMDAKHPSWNLLCEIGESLAEVRGAPMEIVWGMQDWCFTPFFKTAWETRFPGAAVTVLDGAGHYVNEDAPETVIAAIERILAKDAADSDQPRTAGA